MESSARSIRNVRNRLANRVWQIAVVTFLATSALAQPGEDRARDLLKKSMGRAFPVNVVSIIVQRDPSGDGTFQRVKVQRARDGKTRHTVLQPLRLQGIESVDDGDRCLMFLPDERLLIDEPSARKEASDVQWRIRVACQNYRIRLAGSVKIAGRSAAIVVASPKYADLETRKFYIDESTGYPLRMEAVKPGGDAAVVFDTVDIRFPGSIDGELFELRPMGQFSRVRYSEPSSFLTPGSVRQALGFSPVVPVSLPMGFHVQEMQRTQDPKWRALAIRMSDGLARATMYEWSAESGKVNVKAFADSTYREVNGVRLLLVSELGPRQRDRLMEAYASRLENDAQAIVRTAQRSRNVGFVGAKELTARWSLLTRFRKSN